MTPGHYVSPSGSCYFSLWWCTALRWCTVVHCRPCGKMAVKKNANSETSQDAGVTTATTECCMLKLRPSQCTWTSDCPREGELSHAGKWHDGLSLWQRPVSKTPFWYPNIWLVVTTTALSSNVLVNAKLALQGRQQKKLKYHQENHEEKAIENFWAIKKIDYLFFLENCLSYPSFSNYLSTTIMPKSWIYFNAEFIFRAVTKINQLSLYIGEQRISSEECLALVCLAF